LTSHSNPKFLQVISGFYGSAYKDDEAVKAPALTKLKEGLEALDKFLAENGTTFVCGDQPGFTDYMIWPHLERVGAFVPDYVSQFVKVKVFFDAMGEDEAVRKCRWSDEVHLKFFEATKKRNVDYDGLS